MAVDKPTFVFYAPTEFVLRGETFDVGVYVTSDSEFVETTNSFHDMRQVFKRGEEVHIQPHWFDLDDYFAPATEEVEEVEKELEEVEKELEEVEKELEEEIVDDDNEIEFEDEDIEFFDDEVEEEEEEEEEIPDEDEDIDEELINDFIVDVSISEDETSEEHLDNESIETQD